MMADVQVMEELFTIQQIVRITELSAHTLRYYERVGLMQRVGRDGSSGYRHYTREDIVWIEYIKRLRATGMPIRDVQRYVNLLREGDETVRLQLLKEHRQRVEEQQKEAERHLSVINKKIILYEQLQLQRLKTEQVQCM